MAGQPGKISRLTPELRDSLVAYLDGELDDAGTRAIERVLADSPIAQHDVDMLTRTWKMLDLLPEVTPSETFTQQTMQTVLMDEVRPDLTTQPWFQWLRRGAIGTAWATVLATAAAAGFLATYRWMPRASDPLVEDLEVIEQLDAYQAAGSVDFLRQLDRQELLPEGEASGP